VRLSRVVDGVQYATLALCAVSLGMLFVYDPSSPQMAMSATDDQIAAGAEVYAGSCSSCHGDDGDGPYGPSLATPELLAHFPEAEDQVAFVAAGTDRMPGFADDLSADQLAAVVAYTRQVFAGEGAPTGTIDPAQAERGTAIYAESCDGCHGPSGEGGFGPQLAGGAVVESFPDPADQIALVTEGRGSMPGYADEYSEEDIAAVVAYTRSLP
jgi:mono/diheme cytochrome c family protein